jgi:Xaa-Pro dipeptidase
MTGELFAGWDLDPARMRRERLARLQAQMAADGLDALLLVGLGNVTYATGAVGMSVDLGHAVLERVAAVVPAAGPPHLCTPWPEGAPPELPAEHVHPAADTETAEGVAALARLVQDAAAGLRRLGVDDHTPAMWFGLGAALPGVEVTDAAPVLAAAKVQKTADELACIRRAQRINEIAAADVQAALRPGLRQCDLTALFLERVAELGATGNTVDPIWQPMPPSRAAGPWTTTGDLAFPTPTTDRILREGDVLWTDTGINYLGYASDFGRTWIVSADPRPTPAQRDQFRRWRDVVDRVLAALKPGATAGDLVRAACEGEERRPWLPHFYLAHGVGTESAEMPLVGTDLGPAFDDALVMTPGMVLVLEPAVFADGTGGYRAEDIVAVTDDGWIPLSDYPYSPYEPLD